MSQVATVGASTVGGGVILGPGAPWATLNGAPIALVGDAVASHGSSPHAAAVLTAGSSIATLGGVALCRNGDPASCGHTISASSFVDVSA